MSFSIDGARWEYPCQIERTAEVTASDLSSLMLDKSYFNDVLGTWLRYSLTLAVPIGNEPDYYAIYDALTAPVEGHDFTLPYNSTDIDFFGRVLSVSDVWIQMTDGNYWKGTRFEIIASEPSKEATLDDVVTRGHNPVAPLPWSGVVRLYIDDDGYLHQVKTDGQDLDFYIDEGGVLHKVTHGTYIEYTPYGWERVLFSGDDLYF
jgi:hypothetical protein